MAKNKYRSKFESKTIVPQLQRAKVDFEYETKEIPYRSKVVGGKCTSCGSNDVFVNRVYIPDFVLGIPLLKAAPCYLEGKGRLDRKNRKKFKEIKQQHPDLDLRFIFMYDNKIEPKSKTRYSDWAEDLGYKYCFMKIPRSWINEFKKQSKETKVKKAT